MSSLPTLTRLQCPPALSAAELCGLVLQHCGHGADLTRATVIVPELHAAGGVARALREASGMAAVLLPRITTLPAWAAEVVLDEPVDSTAAREAAIYHALNERSWFQYADLWSVAAELAALLDELTCWHVGLPASAEDFVARLEQAYAAHSGASFDFEARLVHAMWRAAGTTGLSPAAAYRLRLGMLAREVCDPIFAVGLETLTPAEEEFLRRCAQRVPVFHLREDLSAARGFFERTLHAAWGEGPEPPLRERAAALRAAAGDSALRDRIRIFGAADAEEEAAAIAASVRSWLHAGRSRIAVVTLDRLVARRARALLERAQILVRDESGWPLSTTSAATVIGRWFDLVSNHFYYRDLLDLLKSPFAFADRPRSERQEAVWRLEQILRRANVRSGLQRHLRAVQQSGAASCQQLLERVQQAERLFRGARRSLAAWLAALEASLGALGIRRGLERDAAGAQILELLAALARDLAGDRRPVPFGDFRRWMARRLEAAAFRDTSIESSVVFTSLEATSLRGFDAVLLTGADAERLPGSARSTRFFNQRVRAELGLPAEAERVQAIERLLVGLLSRSGEVLITWQRRVAGEPNLLSPMLERLRTLHALAWGEDLVDTMLARAMPQLAVRHPQARALPGATVAPAPRVPPHAVPETISASAYNALLACPYRFYARYVLGLRESDEVQEELEKADYGIRVHEILTRFHRAYPSILDLSPQASERALHEISEAVFRDDIERDYLAKAWLARWHGVLPAYLDWQRQREAEGWRFLTGEADRCVRIETPSGRHVVLRGRLDRVDAHRDGALAVIDYKTRARKALETDLQAPGEDVQLPVYALLWNAPLAEALYLPLDAGQVDPVALKEPLDVHANEVRARLAELIDAMAAGAPLPAQGTEAACRYCEAQALCRRKHWP